MQNRIKPIFIFSLPRSGSTLLQRILSKHEKIVSTPEPWLLLPLIYSYKNKGVYSEYDHQLAVKAINDFVEELPNKKQDYISGLRDLVLDLYTKIASHNKQPLYFLDKTPRYHLIVEEIIDIFPEAKFIFLWRNPLSIIASIVNTWGNDKWKLHISRIDLYKGLENLINTYVKNRNNVLCVNYENLITNIEYEIERIFKYLELEPLESKKIEFDNKNLLKEDRMGDNTGLKYKTINNEPLYKWKNVINNPVRKYWAIKYLNWINKERLKLIGYDYDKLINEIRGNQNTFHKLIPDIINIVFGWFIVFFEGRIIKNKINDFKRNNFITYHK